MYEYEGWIRLSQHSSTCKQMPQKLVITRNHIHEKLLFKGTKCLRGEVSIDTRGKMRVIGDVSSAPGQALLI